MNDELSVLQKIIIWALPVFLAITVHEAAHGWVAYHLGDDTAHRAGRITLNPLKHIDPIGTVLLPLILVAFSNFIFGWAKPVPVNFRQLFHPRRDSALVSLAGPLANLFMAIFWVMIAQIDATLMNNEVTLIIALMAWAGISINAALMVLNLLPILPLDGGRILQSLLPPKLAVHFARLEPLGLTLLLILLVTGILDQLLLPVIKQFIDLLLLFLTWFQT